MKPIALSILTVLFSGTLAVSAFAQDQPEMNAGPGGMGETKMVERGNTTIVTEPNNTQDLNMTELQAFGQVTSQDPAVEKDLARNPKLVMSDSFVKKHAALQQFLSQYPNAKEDIVANPGNYLTPSPSSSWNKAAPGIKGKSSASKSDTSAPAQQ